MILQLPGNENHLLAEGVRADRTRVLEAGRRMAYQMRDELWGFFGFATAVTVHSDSIEITIESTTGRAEDVAAAQIHQGVQRRLSTSPAATVMRAVEDQLWRWRRARAQMTHLIGGCYHTHVDMRTYPAPIDAGSAVQLSWSYADGSYVVNPFTWWLQGPSGWVRGIREASSDRARAAHGPALHAYHETVHEYNCVFGARTCQDRTARIREPATVHDVDWAFRDHTAIAQRVGYGGTAGCLSFLREGRADYPPNSARTMADEWVVFPTLAELASGAVMPGTWSSAACDPPARR
jgi:hypothetical protein